MAPRPSPAATTISRLLPRRFAVAPATLPRTSSPASTPRARPRWTRPGGHGGGRRGDSTARRPPDRLIAEAARASPDLPRPTGPRPGRSRRVPMPRRTRSARAPGGLPEVLDLHHPAACSASPGLSHQATCTWCLRPAGRAPPQGRAGDGRRPRRRLENQLIEDAYREGERGLGLRSGALTRPGRTRRSPIRPSPGGPRGPGEAPHEYLGARGHGPSGGPDGCSIRPTAASAWRATACPNSVPGTLAEAGTVRGPGRDARPVRRAPRRDGVRPWGAMWAGRPSTIRADAARGAAAGDAAACWTTWPGTRSPEVRCLAVRARGHAAGEDAGRRLPWPNRRREPSSGPQPGRALDRQQSADTGQIIAWFGGGGPGTGTSCAADPFEAGGQEVGAKVSATRGKAVVAASAARAGMLGGIPVPQCRTGPKVMAAPVQDPHDPP